MPSKNIIAVSACHALLLTLLFGYAIAAEPAAQIISLSGQGETRPSEQNPWSKAAIAQQLNPGADIRTLNYSSAALLLADQTQLRMNANAQIRLRELGKEKTQLQLVIGRIWSRTKRASGALELETPAALAVVRGTDWDVVVDEAGRTTLTVLSGLIEVSNAFGQVEVGPAEEAYVEPGQAPIKRVLINPAERVQWVMANPIDIDRYVEFAASGSEAPLLQIRSLIANNDFAQAYLQLSKLAEQAHYQVAAELMLADFELFSGRFARAAERLARLWTQHQEPRAAARYAEVLISQSDMDAARVFLDQALTISPNSAELLMASGSWWRLQGQVNQALDAYRQAITLATLPATQAAAYHGLGRTEMERGNLRQARSALTKAVALAPDNAEFQGELALESTLSYRLAAAELGYAAALALARDDYVSLAGSGLAALQRGETELAREQFLKAVTIEPRFARGQLWLAVAEFQLGNRAAALDSLERAMQADPKDPIPWQVFAVIKQDMGEPVAAITAAREALSRLPYLKSLAQLANDSQGSANLGKALGDFGLEHWARAYAEESSHPLWAGSHFFMSNRLDSDFARRSELFKGYLSDPTVFGAGSAVPTLFAKPETHVELESLLWRAKARDDASVAATVRGLKAEPFRVAWLLQAQGLYLTPRETGTVEAYHLREGGLVMALGLKPIEELGFFLLHNQSKSRLRFSEPLDLGNSFIFEQPEYYHLRRTDGGVSYRWTADSQTSFKAGLADYDVDSELSHFVFGPQDRQLQVKEDAIHLQHTHLVAQSRLNIGTEQIKAKSVSQLGDSEFLNELEAQQEFRQAWIATEWRKDQWSLYAEGYWPQLTFQFVNRAIDPQLNQLIFPAIELQAKTTTNFLPRIGLTKRFGVGNAFHFGYLETLQAAGNHTLAPVMLGGIPIDHQFLLPGSHARKIAAHLDMQLNPKTFLSLAVQQQQISNIRDEFGALFAQRLIAIPDAITRIGPREFIGAARLVRYDTRPLFAKGEIQRASIGLDRILNDRLALMFNYAYSDSQNEEAALYGNLLPGFARHDAATILTYHHGERNYSVFGVHYMGEHFLDESNLLMQRASGSLAFGHSRESKNRDWRFDLGAVGLGHRDQKPAYFVKLFRRW